ncbi:hypothetical protein L6164_029611 [Bauhinia variegata]|uniref:Uncharacterized protein n=1 Tax=Bauhinia variegata TaxID=167791 RepID=A0ACB9L9S3_BAUVA|nr:hypothetical protein L6164_029611 [Bauhinia variegata]
MGWWCSSASVAATASTSPFCRRYCLKSPTLKIPDCFHLNISVIPASSSSPSSSISSLIKITVPSYNRKAFNKTNSDGFEALIVRCTSGTDTDLEDSPMAPSAIDCVGTGQDVECLLSPNEEEKEEEAAATAKAESWETIAQGVWEWAVLVSPFYFWGTAMVAMKEVIPKSGPFFVSSFRLIPAGFLLVAFAASRGRRFPSGFNAWLSISLFALVDATCFQGFLAEGLQRTSAGLGSVIIDSQPLTVAVLAALLFGESIGIVGAAGLLLGVVGLALLELPALSFDENSFSLWGSGEWWMLLAAQSMAVGTVMVRWVSKYSDPIMATGWHLSRRDGNLYHVWTAFQSIISKFRKCSGKSYLHMVIGGLPLVAISILNGDPAITGNLKEFSSTDILALLYTSIFGSAVSYGVFFYSATKGSLTKLSSLTFLTPMFASIFGFLYLGETFSPLQLVGAVVTLAAIYMVNYKDTSA